MDLTHQIDKLTPRVRTILGEADRIAESMGHQYIGTEHLLLAMIEVGGGVASAVIEKAGVSETLVRKTREVMQSERYAGRAE